MIDIFVPTYKRKDLKIFNMLNDKKIRLNLCVRSEEADSGFYDEFKSNEQIKIVRLGYGITDIGETRRAIIDYCIKEEIDYCPMLDDGVVSLDSSSYSYSEIIRHAIAEMITDDLSKYIAFFTFRKNKIYFQNGAIRMCPSYTSKEKYFSEYPVQAYIINVKVLRQNKIQYKSLKYGFEDTTIVLDCLKKGLVFLANPDYMYSGVEVDVPKDGGNHASFNDLEKIRNKYNKLSKIVRKDYSDMMGVDFVGKYSNHLKGWMLRLEVNFVFFRKVLCLNREKNKEIIKSEFSKKSFEKLI